MDSTTGECPKCKSLNIKYGKNTIDDEGCTYECVCSDCNTKFYECYLLVYSESIIIE